jgi:hypothetical protein
MKTFWIEMKYKLPFLVYIRDSDCNIPQETSEPYVKYDKRILKYYKYVMDLSEDEYLFLKLMFDLKETI